MCTPLRSRGMHSIFMVIVSDLTVLTAVRPNLEQRLNPATQVRSPPLDTLNKIGFALWESDQFRSWSSHHRAGHSP